MWTSVLRVRATVAASPPATTRRARTSASAKRATGARDMTVNVRPGNKMLAPVFTFAKRDGLGLTLLFLLPVCVCFLSCKAGGREEKPHKCWASSEIPFFVMAVSHSKKNRPAALSPSPRATPLSSSGPFLVLIKCVIFTVVSLFPLNHTQLISLCGLQFFLQLNI